MNRLDKAILKANAQERLDDARALFAQGRYHGAAYICGYAVEFALKARICETLDIDFYPEEREFKIHELRRLLLLSGRQRLISNDHVFAKLWATITGNWTVEMRYQSSSSFSRFDAEETINAVTSLLSLL